MILSLIECLDNEKTAVFLVIQKCLIINIIIDRPVKTRFNSCEIEHNKFSDGLATKRNSK